MMCGVMKGIRSSGGGRRRRRGGRGRRGRRRCRNRWSSMKTRKEAMEKVDW